MKKLIDILDGTFYINSVVNSKLYDRLSETFTEIMIPTSVTTLVRSYMRAGVYAFGPVSRCRQMEGLHVALWILFWE